jgi:hypothetical protein
VWEFKCFARDELTLDILTSLRDDGWETVREVDTPGRSFRYFRRPSTLT